MPIPTPSTPPPPRPRILVPSPLSPDGLALLHETCAVDTMPGLTGTQLESVIHEYDALIIRSETQVTEEVLKRGKRLRVVARAGVGVDNVDVGAATTRGVVVVNSPGGNVNAAAEHSVALMLALARNIAPANQSFREGKWERSRLVGVEVKGKTLAIIGAGKVGLTVARLATGMGMKVLAYDPYANAQLAAAASVTLVPTLPALLKEADFLTIHTPLIASTRGIISSAELAALKPSAMVLNVARGGTIDETALLGALDSGALAGAALDVFSSEPPAPGSVAERLVRHPKVLATPHLGASTREAQENVSLDVCAQVLAILGGELPRSAVNAPLILPEEYRALQPFVGLVEKMGALYTQHYSRGHGHGHGAAAFRSTFDLSYEGHLATLNTTKPLFAALIKGLLAPISGSDGPGVNMVNAEVVAKERGILVNEQRARASVDERGYASSVTLRARPAARDPSQSRGGGTAQARGTVGDGVEQVIQGFVSADTPYISRLDRFVANFVPQGTLLICRNFDSCGKIGFVGSRLGRAGVNISSMIVAPLVNEGDGGPVKDHEASEQRLNESLMILGVDRPVDADVVKGLIGPEGVLEASVVVL